MAVWRSTSTVGILTGVQDFLGPNLLWDMMARISLGGREGKEKDKRLRGVEPEISGGARGWEAGSDRKEVTAVGGGGRSWVQSPAVEGIPLPVGRGEGQCSEEGEVTAGRAGYDQRTRWRTRREEERRGRGSPTLRVRSAVEGCPQLSGAIRPPGLHFLASRRHRVVWAAVWGRLTLRSPHPTQTNTPAPLRGPAISSKTCPASPPRDEYLGRGFSVSRAAGAGEGGDRGEGQSWGWSSSALDRLSAQPPSRAAESGANRR